ncbi:hypothetical protein [Agrilactobacillus composti]|uniref:hypothetical protein n=1 Tax=Agrilactobacillus composti TaxID=398555 RepID=UPI0005562A7F|nr:hypothetical protein [Agrilactobacillus composti]
MYLLILAIIPLICLAAILSRWSWRITKKNNETVQNMERSQREIVNEFEIAHPNLARLVTFSLWLDVIGSGLLALGWLLNIVFWMIAYYATATSIGQIALYICTPVGILCLIVALILRQHARRIYRTLPIQLPKTRANKIFVASRLLMIVVAVLVFMWMAALPV